MKLIVFGASGATGKLVVEQALQQGHEVTAFVRHPEKQVVTHNRLRLVKGDVLQPASIEAAMPGHDAVICCIGAPANKAFHIRSEGTKNIVAAMKRVGINRLICQTSMGFGDSAVILRNTPFVFRKLIVPFLLKTTFSDHALQERCVQESGINWTIVRPGSLLNKPAKGIYLHGFAYTDSAVKVKIARADVADFMLQQLSNPLYQQKTTGLSY